MASGDHVPTAEPHQAPGDPAAALTTLMRGSFLATMSHELRTPMVGVLGFARLLADSPLDAGQLEFVRAIEECGRELLATIDHVLLASALEAGAVRLENRSVELRPLLEEALRPFAARAAEKRLALTLVVAPDTPRRIVADAARLGQLLRELLDNALKFTDAGSVLLKVWSEADRDSQRLYVSVGDSGSGVPANLRPQLFRAFVQADSSSTRRHGGLGLGLAICRQLVELMGGAIGVDGGAGEGSRFWFSLPVVVAAGLEAPAASAADTIQPFAAPAAAARADLEAAAAAGDVRVLVVDDNPVNQKVARHVLERLGCRVDLAADGAQAVARSKEAAYDLILMDCHMPQLDGFDAAWAIRRREPLLGRGRTPIVALTASTSEADRARGVAAGMDAFLNKPVEPEALDRVLRRFTLLGLHRPAATPASATG